MLRRVAIGTASNAAGRGVSLVVWFLLTPFILDHLGPTGFGIWTLATSLMGFGYLLDLGLAGAIVKYVAEHRARDEMEAAGALVASAVRAYLVLGALTMALAVILASVTPAIFTIPARDASEAQATVLLVGIGIAVTVAGTPVMAVLRGLQRFDLYNAVLIVNVALTAIVTVIVLGSGGGLVAMVAGHLPITVLSQVVALLLARRVAPWLRFRRQGSPRVATGRIVRFSGALFAMDASGRLQTRADELIIGAMAPIAAVTPYALSRRLAEIPQAVVDQFVKVLMPLASELEASDAGDRLHVTFLVSIRTALAVFVPACIVLLAFGGDILSVWVGPVYAAAAPIVAVLSIAATFRALSWPTASLLAGIGRHHRVAVMSVASGIANITLSIALIVPVGIIGVAWGTLVPTAVESVLVLGYGASVLGVTWSRTVREAILPALLPAIPAALVLLAARWVFDPTGLWFLVPAALTGIAYLGGYLVMPGTRAERAVLRSVLRAGRLRLTPARDGETGGS